MRYHTNMTKTQTDRTMSMVIASVFIFLATMFASTGVASAHDFDGEGDCEGWTLTLDGTHDAHTIKIDGKAYAPRTSYTFPDESLDEYRSFTVTWVKKSSEFTKKHKLSRNTDGCKPTTTTTTTTTAPPTSTTQPTTTTTEPPVTTSPPPTVPPAPPATPTPEPPDYTG